MTTYEIVLTILYIFVSFMWAIFVSRSYFVRIRVNPHADEEGLTVRCFGLFLLNLILCPICMIALTIGMRILITPTLTK